MFTKLTRAATMAPELDDFKKLTETSSIHRW